MLLVNDDQAKVAELHIVLDDCVRPNKDVYAAVEQSDFDCGTFFALNVPR